MKDNTTKIIVCKKTADRLKELGNMGSTYDSLLNDMMDHVEECNLWWNQE